MKTFTDPDTGQVWDLEELLALKRQGKSLDEHGRERLSSTPVAPPIGYNRQPSLWETIRNMVRSERLAEEVRLAGAETFDEADDFDVGDDFDPSSPYEMDFDLASPAELRERRKKAEEAEAPPHQEPKETEPPAD